MKSGSIWWGQIGSSLRLLTAITNNLRDCRSAVLQVPPVFPWRADFYEAVDLGRAGFCGERRLLRLAWQSGADPGAFVLDELCSSRVRAEYWPGQTYAAYLGSRNDIVLCDYYVWVTGIRSKTDLARWAEFVSQYEHCAEGLDSRAVFILEYDGLTMEGSGVERIVYSVEDYDCRVFCLEAAMALANTDLRAYQAELALCIGGSNPEFCSALLEIGQPLLYNPVKATLEVISSARSSEGLAFPAMQEQQINSAAWKAAIVLLFPTLEQYRMDFVSRYEAVLARHLPISNSNGEQVTDPFDLEIGTIHHIVSSANPDFSGTEYETIRLCRRVRNLLAHNKPVPYGDIKKMMSL